MPLTYIADSNGLAEVRGTNPMSTAEALASINRQAREGDWSKPCLVDLRGVTWLPTPWEIRRLICQIEHLNVAHDRRGSVAFIVDDHKALFGMLRMYSILADDIGDIDVFDTVDDALGWLMQRTPRTKVRSEHAEAGVADAGV